MLENINKEIEACGNIEKAKILQRFFKTNKGEYGEGDIFLGLTSPQCKNIVKKYDLTINEIQQLLKSSEHEKRSIALSFLIKLYNHTKNEKGKNDIIKFYLSNTKYINNWDLVDISCYKIIGDYVYKTKNYDILRKLSKSKNLWERRISIVSTMVFAKKGEHEIIFELIKPLLKNEHDLINKATGWILRELGKIDEKVMENFIRENIIDFSSISLSYATEKFTKEKRKELQTLRKNIINVEPLQIVKI